MEAHPELLPGDVAWGEKRRARATVKRHGKLSRHSSIRIGVARGGEAEGGLLVDGSHANL